MMVDPVPGLAGLAVHDLAQAGDGRIAVSTGSGLSLYDSGNFIEDAEISPNSPLTVDAEGQLWAGGAVLRGNQWDRYYLTNSGLRHSHVSDVVSDSAGRLWFAHAPLNGVSVRGEYLARCRKRSCF